MIFVLFWTNDKKGHLDEIDFHHCYENFFWKCHSGGNLIITILKIPYQRLQGTLTGEF